MNKQTAFLCAVFICLAHSNTLADEATDSGSPESSRNSVEAGADSTRDKRPTNTEETNRRYQNEEIRNADPPPVRVRNQPTPTPR
jgi:hypothetical protein